MAGTGLAGDVATVLSRRRCLGIAATGFGALLLAGCGQMPPEGSAGGGGASAPAGVSVKVVDAAVTEPTEMARIVVEGGKVSPAEISLSTKDATELHVVNNDDVAYSLSIDTLVDATEVGPKKMAVVGFTSPFNGRYNGYLKSADKSSEIGQFVVDVRNS